MTVKHSKHRMHPMSLANLAIGRAKLVEKRLNGELSNPEGSSLTSALKHGLNKPFQVPDADATVRDHIVYKTLKGAYDLVPVAFKETWDRAEGKVEGDNEKGDTNIQINIYSSIPRPEYKEIEDATE